MTFETIREIWPIDVTAESEALRDLRRAMRLIASTSRTSAGYEAIRDAARVVFHNEMAGKPDNHANRAYIEISVKETMREYVAMGGKALGSGEDD